MPFATQALETVHKEVTVPRLCGVMVFFSLASIACSSWQVQDYHYYNDLSYRCDTYTRRKSVPPYFSVLCLTMWLPSGECQHQAI